jgi:CHAT domain
MQESQAVEASQRHLLGQLIDGMVADGEDRDAVDAVAAHRIRKQDVRVEVIGAPARRRRPRGRHHPVAASTSQRDNGDTTERGRSPGLGLHYPGEGIFGLRRAVEIADARSVLVTIWDVPSGPTVLLMREFYRALLLADSANGSHGLH